MPVGRERGKSVSNGSVARGEIGRGDPLPAGPYAVGMTLGPNGAGWPYTVIGGDGRAIAGQVNSQACAQAIVDALNRNLLP